MIPPSWTDAERKAFWRGFELAQPPGGQELDDLARIEEAAPVTAGRLRVAAPSDLARDMLAETETLPENLAGATWIGFMRGLIAKAGGVVMNVHEGGRA